MDVATRCFKVNVGTKNALDFQSVSYLGYRICNGNDSSLYYIVSSDKGFYRFTYHFQKNYFIQFQRKICKLNICKYIIAKAHLRLINDKNKNKSRKNRKYDICEYLIEC